MARRLGFRPSSASPTPRPTRRWKKPASASRASATVLGSRPRSPKLAAFVTRNGPPDHFVRLCEPFLTLPHLLRHLQLGAGRILQSQPDLPHQLALTLR